MRSVLFDVDGVLVHGFHARPERRRRWDAHIGEDLGLDPDLFHERFGAFISGVFKTEVLTGRTSLVTALSPVLPELGFRGSPLSFIHYWLTRDAQVNHRLLDVAKRLRQSGRARLFVATNQEHMRALHLWGPLGFGHVFDDLFHSAGLGALKPDPAFFRRVAEALGPQATPPLLFDDSPPVVEAANAFGWEAVLYDDLPDCAAHPWVAEAIAGSPPPASEDARGR